MLTGPMIAGTDLSIAFALVLNTLLNLADAKLKYPRSTNGRDYIRGCYYTNWAQYRHGKGRYLPENYFPGLCTHIFYAFAMMNESFYIRPYEWNDETTDYSKGMYERVNDLKKLQPGLKTLLSFGGWTFSEKNKILLQSMASSLSSRQTFIASALGFVKKNNFDGFDLDWEYPGADDKQNFAVLLKEMSKVFRENGLLLTAAVAAAIPKIDAGYDATVMAETLDFINVMTYDIHGSWENITGFNSPLFDRNGDDLSMATAARYWAIKGLPKEKIIIGFATYGRSWTLLDEHYSKEVGSAATTAKAGLITQEAGFLSYYEICELAQNGGIRYFDQIQKVPYLIHEKQWVGFDDIESYKIKLKWLKENKYGGIFVWTLDLDDFAGVCLSNKNVSYPLIRTVYEELTKSSLTLQVTEEPKGFAKSGSSRPALFGNMWTMESSTGTTRMPAEVLPYSGNVNATRPESSGANRRSVLHCAARLIARLLDSFLIRTVAFTSTVAILRLMPIT